MDMLHSDFDSFSESSGSDDHDDIELLYGPQAFTIFSSLEESIQKLDDLLMFERGFSNGDIIRLVSDPLGQMGKVVNVDMIVDMEDIFANKIRSVDSMRLRKIRSVSAGDHVIYGPWLGKVERVVETITILFDDGTKCRLSGEGEEKVIALSPDLAEDLSPFYPGQRVRVDSSLSRSTHWLCGMRKEKQEQGTICNVDVGFVYVDWLHCAISSSEKGPTPSCLQDLRNLCVLHSCLPTNWRLGDWGFLPVEQSSPSDNASAPLEGQKRPEMLISGEKEDPCANSQNIGVIVKAKTKLDVIWQDGSRSSALDSHSVSPVNILDAHDFWPDVFVLENGTVDGDSQRWGVVGSVDPKERTVKVKWCNLIDTEEEEREEIVSAYELVEHPDYCYNLGEIVFRAEKGILDHTLSNIDAGEKIDSESGNQTTYLNKKFLSYFGTVVGIEKGAIEVQWGTGVITKVEPYEIARVDKCDETVQPPTDEQHLVKNQLSSQNIKDVSDLNDENAKDSNSCSISQVAIELLTNMASNLFGNLGGTSLFSGYRCTSEVEDVQGKPYEEEAVELCSLNLDGQLPAVEIPENITSLPIKDSESFKQFDMVNDCSDHHFVNEIHLQSPQVKRGWLKKVHQEWSILEKDLPENIYIRVYEEKIHLLRAAIVGADGTPYHDGLFFFDIHLPPEYPNEPPMVYYNSGGLRVNPNLYESGKVCLSLLNTWTGSGNEVWNPESSTILQVLLSLQALVLNEKPYFNEAGYDTQVGKAEGRKNSFSYNENAFLVSCRSMLYLLRKPPKHFESLVDEHFRSRCKKLLEACNAYMQGAPIGHPFNRGEYEEIEKGSSTGFKILLTKIYSKLIEAFSDKGIELP